MQVCQEALDIHGSLISPEQYLWQEELKGKFRHMQIQLSPLLSPHHKVECIDTINFCYSNFQGDKFLLFW